MISLIYPGKRTKALLIYRSRRESGKFKSFQNMLVQFHHYSTGVSVSGQEVTSTLLISAAVLGDAGQYSCTLPAFGNMDFPRARLMVHIIYGKKYCQSFVFYLQYVQGDQLAVQAAAEPVRKYSRYCSLYTPSFQVLHSILFHFRNRVHYFLLVAFLISFLHIVM
jgi:hypothetical protein